MSEEKEKKLHEKGNKPHKEEKQDPRTLYES